MVAKGIHTAPKLSSFNYLACTRTSSFTTFFDPDNGMIISSIKMGVQSLLLHDGRDSASSSSASISSRSSSQGGLPAGIIASIVLGSFALLSIMCSGLWFLHYWRRRHVVKPSPTTRVDLAETEVERVDSPTPMDVAETGVPVSFPHPYPKVTRRYPPGEMRTIEPPSADVAHSELQSSHAQSKQPDQCIADSPPWTSTSGGKTMRRHTTPFPTSLRPPIDQLDLDLACLSGDAIDKRVLPHTIRPLPSPPVPTSPVQQTIKPISALTSDKLHPKKNHSSSHDKSGMDSHPKSTRSPRRKRAATLTTPTASPTMSPSIPSSSFAKEKYYHRLPPSARYLADIARYPNSVDPTRPWNVLKDDVVDVKDAGTN